MTAIERHRTAISRNKLSKPVRLALEADVIRTGDTIMDYGCGRGDDLGFLTALGFDAVGWDPAHAPDGPKRASTFVNLGYVLNVIEKPAERVQTLKSAWALAKDALLVSAMVVVDASGKAVPYGDGVLTTRGTFQKYYDQGELENYLRSSLGTDPIALGMGIFVILRDPKRRADLAASRFRRRKRLPDSATAEKIFAENEAALEPLVAFVQTRGRLPTKTEQSQFHEIADRFGSVRRAFGIVQRAIPPEFWEEAAAAARNDLLVYLGAAKLGGRPKFTELSDEMQEDVRGLFGSYAKAVKLADETLGLLASTSALRAAAKASAVGKVLPDAIYIHVSALGEIPLLLRLYEGLVRRYIGDIDTANIIKLGLDRPVVTYLSYPDFDDDAHPALKNSLKVDLGRFRIKTKRFDHYENPPILHRKELFVTEDYPLHGRFTRLTKQEEKWDLYEGDHHTIGTRKRWNERLARAGVEIRGHRLYTKK